MRVRSKLVFPNRNGGYAPLGHFQAVRAVQGWGHGAGHEFHADPIRARRARPLHEGHRAAGHGRTDGERSRGSILQDHLVEREVDAPTGEPPRLDESRSGGFRLDARAPRRIAVLDPLKLAAYGIPHAQVREAAQGWDGSKPVRRL